MGQSFKTVTWDDEMCTLLRAIYTYNPDTGEVYRRIRMGRGDIGVIPATRGGDNSMCYQVNMRYKGKLYGILTHRLAYFLHTGQQPHEVVHRDGNKANNKADNLLAFEDSRGRYDVQRTRFIANMAALPPGNFVSVEFSEQLRKANTVASQPAHVNDDRRRKVDLCKSYGINWKKFLKNYPHLSYDELVDKLAASYAIAPEEKLVELAANKAKIEQGIDPFPEYLEDGRFKADVEELEQQQANE